MAHKIHPEVLLDVTKINPKSSSKYLIDFQNYINSKRCYSTEPLNQAEIQAIKPCAAYQCKIKILLEQRQVTWSVKPTKQRLSQSTKPTFDFWNDYQFQLPTSAEKKSEQKRSLSEHDYTTDCQACQGQGTIQCVNQRCIDGNEICLACNKGLRSDGSACPQCKNGFVQCQTCRGRGRLDCAQCDSCGVFHHSAVLQVWWEVRTSIWHYQNSFLPEEIIDQEDKISLWSKSERPWTQNSSIENFFQSLDEFQSTVPLKVNLIRDYREKYLYETMKMRRLTCDIERLDFEEIEYTLASKYHNEKDSMRGTLMFVFSHFLSFLSLIEQEIDFDSVNTPMLKDINSSMKMIIHRLTADVVVVQFSRFLLSLYFFKSTLILIISVLTYPNIINSIRISRH